MVVNLTRKDKEVNCTDHSPIVSVPCFCSTNFHKKGLIISEKKFLEVDGKVGGTLKKHRFTIADFLKRPKCQILN